MKGLLKLVFIALAANALWRVGSEYMTFYKFKDAVYEAAMAQGRTDDELRAKIVELAAAQDLPLAADDIAIRREENHTAVEGTYTRRIAVLPGYERPWPFTVNVDAYVVAPPTRRRDLATP